MGVPQEPGRSCRFRRRTRMGQPVISPWSVGVVLVPTEANKERSDGTGARRQRSDPGQTAGSRSASLYRGSGGTNPRDPVEGRRRRNTEPIEGNMAETRAL